MNQSPVIVAHPADPLSAERRRLARMPGCRFVEVSEFMELATSWRKMERRNMASCNVLGLFDLETNEWFLIEQEKFEEHIHGSWESP